MLGKLVRDEVGYSGINRGPGSIHVATQTQLSGSPAIPLDDTAAAPTLNLSSSMLSSS